MADLVVCTRGAFNLILSVEAKVGQLVLGGIWEQLEVTEVIVKVSCGAERQNSNEKN
jgi:hypothetical protein